MKKFIIKDSVLSVEPGLIMGILNVTPDSFSDGGLYNTPEAAAAHAEQMVRDGACILDIGAMSTRPGSEKLTPAQELERLKIFLPIVRKSVNVPISVDTIYPISAEYSLNNGAQIINDVSGKFNEEMAAVVKRHGAGWIIMHNRTDNAAQNAEYKNGVLNDTNEFFRDMLSLCENYGLSQSQICLDPGFGFGKTCRDNVAILKNFNQLESNGCVLLAALSRKRFIGEITGVADAEKRVSGSVAAGMLAVADGADMLRVHDVAETSQAIKIMREVQPHIWTRL